MSEPALKSKRAYSKRLVAANIGAAWLVLLLAVVFGKAEVLVAQVFSFVTVLIGIYTGIGHMDYRKAMEVTERAAERMKEK